MTKKFLNSASLVGFKPGTPRFLFAVGSREEGVNEVIAWKRGPVAGSHVSRWATLMKSPQHRSILPSPEPVFEASDQPSGPSPDPQPSPLMIWGRKIDTGHTARGFIRYCRPTLFSVASYFSSCCGGYPWKMAAFSSGIAIYNEVQGSRTERVGPIDKVIRQFTPDFSSGMYPRKYLT